MTSDIFENSATVTIKLDDIGYSLDEMFKEAGEEIKMRNHVYGKRVADGKMKRAVAERKIGRMKALLGSTAVSIFPSTIEEAKMDTDVQPMAGSDRKEYGAEPARAIARKVNAQILRSIEYIPRKEPWT